MFVGGLIGFFLDNLLPGTIEERGIIKWKKAFDANGSNDGSLDVASVHVYDPPFIGTLSKSRICKHIPFLPYYGFINDHVEEQRNKCQENEDDAL